MLELQSLLPITFNDKIYMLSHKVKINKDIKDDEFESEYNKFVNDLMIISKEREPFEIVCDKCKPILDKYGENAYQLSKMYLDKYDTNNKTFDAIFSMLSGAILGSIIPNKVLELIMKNLDIQNNDLVTLIEFLLPIVFWVVIISLFFKKWSKNVKIMLNARKVQNNKFIITILQDFCCKHEREILDNKFPPLTK